MLPDVGISSEQSEGEQKQVVSHSSGVYIPREDAVQIKVYGSDTQPSWVRRIDLDLKST